MAKDQLRIMFVKILFYPRLYYRYLFLLKITVPVPFFSYLSRDQYGTGAAEWNFFENHSSFSRLGSTHESGANKRLLKKFKSKSFC